MPSAATPAIRTPSRSGFTLVEISIVLVIIGLIVGGILVGRNLIRAAEISATIKQAETFRTSMNVFRMKYGGVAGDFPRATSYFAGVTNGNGNGSIQLGWEGYYVWQHLSAAELWPGVFTTPAGFPATVNVNMPEADMNGAHFIVLDSMSFSGGREGWYPTMRNRNVLLLGFNRTPNVNNWGIGPAISPEDAYKIDSKMDDGHPAFGKVQAGRPDPGLSVPHPQCSGDIDENLASYQLNVSEIRCNLSFAIN